MGIKLDAAVVFDNLFEGEVDLVDNLNWRIYIAAQIVRIFFSGLDIDFRSYALASDLD